MALSRRQFLIGAGSLAGVQLVLPAVTRAGAAIGKVFADPSTAARPRLLVVFLRGGNDGLNTVIPVGDVAARPRLSVYRKVRPTLGYAPDVPYRLDRPDDLEHALGLNPRLDALHRLYRDGRVAIVQGVDYPEHSYSHFVSTDIWHSGEPGEAPDSGWLGRHLDRAGLGDGELRGVGLGTSLPLILTGKDQRGVEVHSLAASAFSDAATAEAGARHAALAAFSGYTEADPLRHAAGKNAAGAVDLAAALQQQPAPPASADPFVAQMLTARSLLQSPLGVECVYVSQPGSYDTHAAQQTQHERQLVQLDDGIEAFLFGTVGGQPIAGLGPLEPAIADRTLIMVVSEFGRRLGENSGGTDHGAAAPVFLIGPAPGRSAAAPLRPGLHGDHPDLGTVAAPADNLMMTTDLRAVYQAVLERWLRDPDPAYGKVEALPGLFA